MEDILKENIETESLSQDPIIKQYNDEINTMTLQMLKTKDSKLKYELQNKITSINRSKSFYTFKVFLKKIIFYIILFVILVTNLIAVSVALTCNRDKGIIQKILSGTYALFFGIIYIFINYKYYRLNVKKDTISCTFCPDNPFPI